MHLMINLLLLFCALACGNNPSYVTDAQQTRPSDEQVYLTDSFGLRLSAAAIRLTENIVTYDPAYFVIPYPAK